MLICNKTSRAYLVIIQFCALIVLSGCGKSKSEIEIENLRLQVHTLQYKLEQAMDAVESAQSSLQEARDEFSMGRFRAGVDALDDVESYLADAEYSLNP